MKEIAKKLLHGETVSFRPRGNSMSPIIKDGQNVTLVPILPGDEKLKKGTVVLAKVRGRYMLHKVTAAKALPSIKTVSGETLKVWKYQISNNKGHVNGWASMVFGKVTKVED